MDIAIADVTDVPEVAVGDAAVLLGRASGGASISAAEYGAWAGLSEYEVTCGMSKRVPRTYVGDRRERRERRRADGRAEPPGRRRRRADARAAPRSAAAGARSRPSRRIVGDAVLDRRSRTPASPVDAVPRHGRRPPDPDRRARWRGCRAGRSAAATTSRRRSTSASAACRSCCSSARSPAMVMSLQSVYAFRAVRPRVVLRRRDRQGARDRARRRC